MSHQQLHDFASTKGLHEKTPVHMLKREGISLEGQAARRHAGDLKEYGTADYISGRRSNPHGGRDDSVGDFYNDHGGGLKTSHHGEKKLPHDDTDIKKKVFKNGPRHTSESTQEEE